MKDMKVKNNKDNAERNREHATMSQSLTELATRFNNLVQKYAREEGHSIEMIRKSQLSIRRQYKFIVLTYFYF